MSTRKTLFLDIETAPNQAYVWGHWETNVIEHIQEWHILCAAWQWVGNKKIDAVSLLDDEKAFKENPHGDDVVVKKLWDLLDEADVVISHNGDRFDLRKINTRFLIDGLGPPSPYQSIDTLKVARRYFAFNSNRLDDLGETLNLGRKIKHGGFKMWLGCLAGDAKSWKEMIKYNKRDITLLREVYLKLRPFISNHPNMANLSDRLDSCPTCGSEELHSRGTYSTATMTYRRFHCVACGAYSRARQAEVDSPRPEVIPVTRR